MNQQTAKQRLDEIKQSVRGEWRTILPIICGNPIGKHAGEPMYICPVCGAGQTHHNSGIVWNPKDKNLRCNYGECGFSGDVIDLFMKVNNIGYSTALQELAREIGITDDVTQLQRGAYNVTRTLRVAVSSEPRENVRVEIKPATGANMAATSDPIDYSEYYRVCANRINDPVAVSYLKKRGLSVSTVNPFFIGYDPDADPAGNPGNVVGFSRHPAPRLIIPTSREHYVGRRVDGVGEYKKMNPKGSTPGIFNLQVLWKQDCQTVFVVEGALDALSIIECGGQAVALNSTSNVGMLCKELEKRPTAAVMILALDTDDAGQKATKELQGAFDRLGLSHIKADICGGCGDPNEALVHDKAGFIAAIMDAQQSAFNVIDADSGESDLAKFVENTSGDTYRPYPTGIADVDQRLGGGLMKQQLILLGAEPGAGKTALTAQIFENYARRGQPCLYYALEMSVDQMLARSLARTAYYQGAEIGSLAIMRGYKQTDTQKAVVRAAVDQYRKTVAPCMVYNPDDTGADLDAILESMEKRALKAERQGKPVPICAIDYLQLLTGREREDSVDVLKRAVVGFKRFAIVHSTFVICIMAQSRRANESKGATLAAGRDTSNLEYTADVQMQLQTDENNEALRKLYVTKSRFSSPSLSKHTPLLFRGAQSLFETPSDVVLQRTAPIKKR